MKNPAYQIQIMYKTNKSLTILLLLAILVVGAYSEQPLKALLYCYLPAVNLTNSTQEFNRLANIINTHLASKQINVRVSVCNSEEANKLYDENSISTLFDSYDIVEVDVSYLWAVKTPLLSFEKGQITFYDKVFPFEWEPTTKNGKIVGSPGLLCSTFLETRIGEYEDRLYSKFSSGSALVGLYLNTFLNLGQGRTLESVNYSKVDQETITGVANFLKDCQEDTSAFNYDQNWCFPGKKNFFETIYSTTTGYSQNLFNFINNGIQPQNIQIEHITKTQQKKVFYIDSFVAKDTSDLNKKQTVLSFYEQMLSDQVLDVYVQGKYTDKPSTTYLIPPTIHYLKRLANEDKLYNSIYETAFDNAIQLPLYQREYAQNKDSLFKLINSSLAQIPPPLEL